MYPSVEVTVRSAWFAGPLLRYPWAQRMIEQQAREAFAEDYESLWDYEFDVEDPFPVAIVNTRETGDPRYRLVRVALMLDADLLEAFA